MERDAEHLDGVRYGAREGQVGAREAALGGDRSESPRFQSLDGMWRFHWSACPGAAPTGFVNPDYDVSGWDFIPVPANWEVEGLNNYRQNVQGEAGFSDLPDITGRFSDDEPCVTGTNSSKIYLQATVCNRGKRAVGILVAGRLQQVQQLRFDGLQRLLHALGQR